MSDLIVLSICCLILGALLLDYLLCARKSYRGRPAWLRGPKFRYDESPTTAGRRHAISPAIRATLFTALDATDSRELHDREAMRGFLYDAGLIQGQPITEEFVAFVDILIEEFCPDTYVSDLGERP